MVLQGTCHAETRENGGLAAQGEPGSVTSPRPRRYARGPPRARPRIASTMFERARVSVALHLVRRRHPGGIAPLTINWRRTALRSCGRRWRSDEGEVRKRDSHSAML